MPVENVDPDGAALLSLGVHAGGDSLARGGRDLLQSTATRSATTPSMRPRAFRSRPAEPIPQARRSCCYGSPHANAAAQENRARSRAPALCPGLRAQPTTRLSFTLSQPVFRRKHGAARPGPLPGRQAEATSRRRARTSRCGGAGVFRRAHAQDTSALVVSAEAAISEQLAQAKAQLRGRHRDDHRHPRAQRATT